MMEWVFRDTPSFDPYIKDVIFGSTGAHMVSMENHLAVVRQVAGG